MKNTRFVKLATTLLAGILAWNTKYCGAARSDDGTNPAPKVETNFRQGGDPSRGPPSYPQSNRHQSLPSTGSNLESSCWGVMGGAMGRVLSFPKSNA